MFTTEYSVPSGWMRKACRFGMMHQLKLRYFVLLDKELRYYKYPDDLQPAGMIDLKEFNDVLIYNTGSLYGFKLVSKARGSWKPMLFANSEEERKKWINQIRNKIDRSYSCSIHHYSPPIIRGQFYDPYDNQSVLDKWLLKLNLNDEKKEQDYYFNNISNSVINMNYSKTASSTCSNNKQSRIHSRSDSNASIIGSKNKSFESIDYSSFESPNNSISELPSSSFTRRLSIEYAQKKVHRSHPALSSPLYKQ